MVEDDGGEVDEGVFVVVGGDAASLLQACEAAFDGVAGHERMADVSAKSLMSVLAKRIRHRLRR